MGNCESSTPVNISPEELFEYLSDVENLPRYLPRLTYARRTGGDEVDVTAHIDHPGGPEREVQGQAWIKLKEAGRTLEWGAAGPHDYRGELEVGPGSDPSTANLTVRIHTGRAEGPELQRGCDETVQGIRSNVERASR